MDVSRLMVLRHEQQQHDEQIGVLQVRQDTGHQPGTVLAAVSACSRVPCCGGIAGLMLAMHAQVRCAPLRHMEGCVNTRLDAPCWASAHRYG